MKRMMFAVLALAALVAAAPPRRVPVLGSDQAGNHLIDFAAPVRRGAGHGTADPSALHCTADRLWCARLRPGIGAAAWDLELVARAGPARHFPIAAPEDEFTTLSIWPYMVIEHGGAVILGVSRDKEQDYPDTEGGGTSTILLRAEPGPAPLRQVLDVPSRAYIGVNVCLHPGDSARRFGACWDQADWRATIALDETTRAGPPVFLYGARARTFPAHGVLEREMDRDRPLRRSDVRWAIDPACTYRLRMTYRPRQGIYVADGQFPRCPDYFGF